MKFRHKNRFKLQTLLSDNPAIAFFSGRTRTKEDILENRWCDLKYKHDIQIFENSMKEYDATTPVNIDPTNIFVCFEQVIGLACEPL